MKQRSQVIICLKSKGTCYYCTCNCVCLYMLVYTQYSRSIHYISIGYQYKNLCDYFLQYLNLTQILVLLYFKVKVAVLRFLRWYIMMQLHKACKNKDSQWNSIDFRMWRKEFPFCPQVSGCEISGCWYSQVSIRVRRTEVFGLLSYVHSSVNVARSQTENARHSQRNPTGITSGQQNLLVSCDRR